MADRNSRVLVFDSGVGGLSVAQCIHRALPDLDLVYLADNAGFPYGNKPEPVVTERCCRLILAAADAFACDVIVVACNTASTVALPALRARTSTPVVGVVPAVKPAAAVSQNRRIGILATPATVRRPYLDELVRDFAGDCEVIRVGHPELVNWAERCVAGELPDQKAMDAAVMPLAEAGVDTVVLGCTHYPLLRPWLEKSLPAVRYWVDSGQAIARRVAFLLNQTVYDQNTEAVQRTSSTMVSAALFSGPAPEGIAEFMAELELPVARVLSNWSGDAPPTANGSA
ncbi:MAG: glutamate racemase [Marinobacter sp. 34-60-7]|nr:MAG: glutamate racemase [Marinobacter sp. 34-60-7]